MSKVRILYLEADEADADSIGALVNIVREVQSGRPTEGFSFPTAAQVTELPRFAGEVDDSPPAPTVAAKPRKPRAAKPDATAPVATRGRASNAGGTILAALRKNPRPDRIKLAQAIYGDASRTAKVAQVLGYLVSRGKLKANNDGTFTVL